MMNPLRKPRVLLLGNYRPSLTLARDFVRRGYDISVGSHGCERLCQYSQAVSSIWEHSPLNSGVKVFAKELKQYSISHPELVAVVPVAEEYVRLFAENEPIFDGLPPVVSMDRDLVIRCLDKEYMLSLAMSVGVFTAPYSYVKGLSGASKAISDGVEFPIIVRPKDSTKRIGGDKAVCVETDSELRECILAHDLRQHDLLLQTKFEGKRHNVYFAAIGGNITRCLHAIIDRTDKLDGSGLAVEGRTLNTEHIVVHQTQRLLDALSYTGIGCAQFLVDEVSGKTSFLEINPRIAGNHALPEHAGLELGWFNFERIVHEELDTEVKISPAGLRYSWLTGDLMGAKVSLIRREIGVLSFIGWVRRALTTAIKADLHMVFSFRDPYPAIRGIFALTPRVARWRIRATHPGENTIYSKNERSFP